MTLSKFSTCALFVLLGLSACSRDPLKYVESGKRYQEAGDHSAAIIEFANAIKLDPQLAEAHYRFGISLLVQGQLNDAAREFERTVSIQPEDANAQITYGNILLLAHKFDQAQSAAEAVLKKDASNLRAQLLLANSFAEIIGLNDSIGDLKKVFDAEPRLLPSYLSLGLPESKERRASAEMTYKEAIARQPRSVEAHLTLGCFYLQVGQVKEAEQEFKEAVNAQPASVDARHGLAFFYQQTAQMDLAEQQYIELVKSGGKGHQVILAHFYVSTGRLDKAAEVLKRLLASDGSYIVAKRRLVDLDIRQNALDKAALLAEEILRQYPEDLESQFAKGRILLAQRKSAEAIEQLQRVFKDSRGTPMGRMYLGLAYSAAGDPQRAQTEFLAAVQGDLALGDAYTPLAEIRLATGDVDGALKYAQQALAFNANLPSTHLVIARAYIAKKNYKQAADEIKAVLEREPANSAAQYHQAALDFALGNLGPAESRLEALLKNNPAQSDSLALLATLYMREKRPDKALERVNQAIAQHPEQVDYDVVLAHAYFEQGNKERAEQAYEKAASLDNSISRRIGLADFYQQTGSVDKSIKLLQAVVKDDPANEPARVRLAEVYLRKNDPAAAAQIAEDVLKKNPKSAEAVALKGRVLLSQGKTQDALSLLQSPAATESGSALVRYYLGLAHLQANDRSRAEIEWLEAVKSAGVFPQLLLSLAQLKLDEGATMDAANYAQRALSMDPTLADAQLVLAIANKDAAAYKLAAGLFQEAVRRNPQDAGLRQRLGTVLMGQRDLAGAQTQFEEGLKLSPDSADLMNGLVRVYLTQKHPEQALQRLNQQIAKFPRNEGFLKALADVYISQKDPEKAETALKRAVAIDPKDVKTRLDLGAFYQDVGKLDQSVAIYEEAARLVPGNLGIKRILADVYLSKRSFDRVAVLADELLKGNDKDAHLLKGKLLLAQGKYAEGAVEFQTIVNSNPKAVGPSYLLGLAYYQARDLKKAESAWNVAVGNDPTHATAQLGLARIKLDSGDPNGAIQHAMEALKAAPDLKDAALVLGNAHLVQRDYKGAIGVFEKMAAQDPENAVAHERLGAAYAAAGDTSKASAQLETALKIDPKNTASLSTLVDLDVRRGALDKAVDRINQQIAKAPKEAALYDLLGQVYLEQKNFSKAEQSYRTSISVDRNRPDPYGLLARLYVAQNALGKAVQELETYLKINPNSAETHVLLATLYERQHSSDKAIVHYREGIRLVPDSPIALNNLAWLLADKSESLDEALGLARTANVKSPDNPTILDTTGWIYHKKGAYTMAIDTLKKCVQKAPKDSSCQYHLGLSYLKSGNIQNAKLALNEAIKAGPSSPEAVDARNVLATLQ